MNWNHVAHIVRDVFNPQEGVIYYGYEHDLIDALRAPEHSIEAWGLYTDRVQTLNDRIKEWAWQGNNTFFGHDFAELFISFNYAPYIHHGYREMVAERMSELLRQKNGLIFLVNPGDWISEFDKFFSLRPDLVSEIQRYSMFQKENVIVYGHI